MIYFIVVSALFGHAALAVGSLNRMHAGRWSYQLLTWLDLGWYLWMLAFVVGWCATAVISLLAPPSAPQLNMHTAGVLLNGVWCYVLVCTFVAWTVLPWWVWRQWHLHETSRLIANEITVVDVAHALGFRPCGTRMAKLLAAVPRNEIMQLNVQRKTVVLDRLPQALVGFTITHLSDLHFTGQLTDDFFRLVVDEANALGSALIAITGDIIDHPRCLPWLREILGELCAPDGVYFVLGNHELRVRNETAVRQQLTQAGLIDIGGRSLTQTIRGETVILAGNELPWFPLAENFPDIQPNFSILLAHTPDQIVWAQQRQIDLMLAGHTHGGQIRIPRLGAILSPSRYGGKYASGTFYEHPTLMHVSRGVSGTRQARFNCPPELTQLILTKPDAVSSEATRDAKSK